MWYGLLVKWLLSKTQVVCHWPCQSEIQSLTYFIRQVQLYLFRITGRFHRNHEVTICGIEFQAKDLFSFGSFQYGMARQSSHSLITWFCQHESSWGMVLDVEGSSDWSAHLTAMIQLDSLSSWITWSDKELPLSYEPQAQRWKADMIAICHFATTTLKGGLMLTETYNKVVITLIAVWVCRCHLGIADHLE